MTEQQQEILHGDADLMDALALLCSSDSTKHAPHAEAERHSTDAFGNAYHWYQLKEPAVIVNAARMLKAKQARLCMISAYIHRQAQDASPQICYHFELAGVVYNLTVQLSQKDVSLPSITPVFANADWHERELMELFGINVTQHPNPTRLFLDEELDAGIMNSVIPLSIMMNGASTTDLWERILAGKGDNA